MSCQSNNATPPSPGIAPGIDGLDPRRVAESLAARPGGAMDWRVRQLIPTFDAPFFQAGLAGYSDAAMRLIARRHGCPYCITEALLDRTLLAGGRGFAKADLGELHDNVPGGDEDHPLAGQIMGSDPREMAAAALKMLEQRTRADRDYRDLAYAEGAPPGGHLRLPGGEQLGKKWSVDEVVRWRSEENGSGASPASSLRPSVTPPLSFEAIDVNLACPVKKIERKARGGHWLAEPVGAIAILEAVREVVPPAVACTLKIRRAFDDTPEMAGNFDRILAAAIDMGYDWATVHARTVEQKYVGPSRWDLLRDVVRRHPGMPIFGSGDVWEAGEIFRMIGYTGVAAVSVARGCIGNPWLFRQARDLLAGREPSPPTIPEQRAVLEEHFALLLAVNQGMRHAEHAAARMIRKFGVRFAAHHPREEHVRRRFIAVENLADWRTVLDEEYAANPR